MRSRKIDSNLASRDDRREPDLRVAEVKGVRRTTVVRMVYLCNALVGTVGEDPAGHVPPMDGLTSRSQRQARNGRKRESDWVHRTQKTDKLYFVARSLDEHVAAPEQFEWYFPTRKKWQKPVARTDAVEECSSPLPATTAFRTRALGETLGENEGIVTGPFLVWEDGPRVMVLDLVLEWFRLRQLLPR